jgi:hypothetical protein
VFQEHFEAKKMKGMSHSEMADRRVMLAHNTPMVIEAMKESGFRDPVGIVADTRDNVGRRIVRTALLATGRTEQEAEDHILAMSMEMAKRVCSSGSEAGPRG